MELFEILLIKFKCPKCGREFEDSGKSARFAIDASWIECECGFKGELIG